uniref:nucleotidyltransferase family protein n=1 Tax=Alistipes sp. TaxID=1872444 RepID=UPI00405798E9
MKNIVLAAGYATRLYPITENFPKPLLKIGDSTILDRMLVDIDKIPMITSHIIVSNHKFINHFKNWEISARARYQKTIEIIDDGSTDNNHRVGAVKDLILAIEQNNVEEDILVVAADNLLDFSFQGFIEFFNDKKSSLIMCHEETSITALQKTGVVCLDEENRVVLMEEKPQVPKSHWAVPPFYIYRKEDLPLIHQAIENGCRYDAPGNLALYLANLLSNTPSPLYAWPMPGHRYDIGDIESYEKAKKKLSLEA